MVFQLFSTSAFISPEADLADLPLELSTMILRMLDPQSLVSALLVNRSWSKICRSDNVLRERIRKQLKKKRREQKKFLLDPSYGINVVRNSGSNLFNINVIKSVELEKRTTNLPSLNVPIKIVNGQFQNGKFVGPLRRKKTSSVTRAAPYKICNLR